MEACYNSFSVDKMNVVQLSNAPLALADKEAGHRCSFRCQIEHVWGNLYRCTSSGTTHVCDKNCNQRIVYDNHSSICRASRKVFPLHTSQDTAIRGVIRKKAEWGSSEEGAVVGAFSSKRARDMLSSTNNMPHYCRDNERGFHMAKSASNHLPLGDNHMEVE